MKVLRTPDERFADLPDFPYAPHYTEIADADGTPLRIAHVEAGRGAPVLLMHGEPSWSFLYRKMIAALSAKGHRAIAPDLIGFGRSDKPAARTDYTYERHVAWMSAWLLKNDLTDITLFCQDWGGLIGLRLVAAFPERFARVVVANTGLPTGQTPGPGFAAWLKFSQDVPTFPTSFILQSAVTRPLTDAEKAAYDAPFPDESYKEGARQFPTLVPITAAHDSVAENKAAWSVLEKFEKPFLTAFSDGDPVTKGGECPFQDRVPGAKGQPHTIVKGGGHFLQEDAPEELADILHAFITTP
ncbi:MAG: haloalkane dehalogenase [Alphaproteobacteria bacterium]|nr:haloalkane dehalogenase [Alphaproteobacteria bacterium]